MVAINNWASLKARYEQIRDTFDETRNSPELTIESLITSFRAYIEGMEQVMSDWDKLPESSKPKNATIGAAIIRMVLDAAKQELLSLERDLQ